MNLVIVDDEPLARLRLRQVCDDLNEYAPNSVVAEFGSGAALLKGLMNPELQPDVLLLDVNMPGLDGLELAAHLRVHAPKLAIVLVTAASEHAIQAFELDVTDFVLKPVRGERLLKALQKCALHAQFAVQANAAVSPNDAATGAQALIAPERLVVRRGTQTLSVLPSEVSYFTTEGRTTRVHAAQGSFVCRQSLNELELWLAQQCPGAFLRIHRHTLLALTALEQAQVDDGLQGVRIKIHAAQGYLDVSRRMWPQLKRHLGL